MHCVCGLSFFSLWFGIHVFKGSQVIPVCSQGFNPRAAETSRDLLCKRVGFMFLVKVSHETSPCPHPDPAPSSPSLYTYFCLGGREWLMGCVREDPSSGELHYHFLKAVLSTHERWTELLCPEGVLGTEKSIVEINPEDFANHPEPELALPPNCRNVEKNSSCMATLHSVIGLAPPSPIPLYSVRCPQSKPNHVSLGESLSPQCSLP